jgi:regulatory protein
VSGLAHQRATDPQAQLQEALDLSFSYLGHRDRTVAEVRRHLERKRVEPAAIDGALAELGRLGYLDDTRYAQRFVEDRRRLDAWGAERIERRLVALGVPPEIAAATVGAGGEHDELSAAVELLRRRIGRPPETDHDRERALGLLARRGYELELAYDAVRAFERGA